MVGLCKFREKVENNVEIIGRHSLVDFSLSIQNVTLGNLADFLCFKLFNPKKALLHTLSTHIFQKIVPKISR